MCAMPAQKMVIAVSSSALFDMRESDRVFREEGLEAYSSYQIEQEDAPLEPGEAFYLVQKLLALNSRLEGGNRVEVILLSRNSADTGLRVLNSIQHHGLQMVRAAFSGGTSPYRYVKPFASLLFLSMNSGDVRQALASGVAAATIITSGPRETAREELRIAFDGDSVIFSDEAERIYKEKGLQAFQDYEREAAKRPLSGGPFKGFLGALHEIQKEFSREECPIRTALVTARSAPAHERVIRTLREWNIRIDESLFLGGLPKGPFLEAFGADIFFDDQLGHCDSAREHVPTGHVPHGVANE